MRQLIYIYIYICVCVYEYFFKNIYIFTQNTEINLCVCVYFLKIYIYWK